MEQDKLTEKRVEDSALTESICLARHGNEKNAEDLKAEIDKELDDSHGKMNESRDVRSENHSNDQEKETEESKTHTEKANSKLELMETDQSTEVTVGEEQEPVFDGTEVPGIEACRSKSSLSLDAWPEKAASLRNFVKQKSGVAVSSVLRRLSGKSDDDVDTENVSHDKDKTDDPNLSKEVSSSLAESESSVASLKPMERFTWNPLNYIKISQDAEDTSGAEQKDNTEDLLLPIPMKGRIVLYTRLGCLDCKELRKFLHKKRLGYIEININVYPSRKLELEKLTGSFSVPKVFLNEVCAGGLSELKDMDESGKLDERINDLINEAPPADAPLPPFSGEDDVSICGMTDELAVTVRKMKQSIIVKDRFYKMRMFTNCFLGSEVVDFLSEEEYLEREEAVEFGRKLASECFFQHVLDENLFEDGNHLYRFLDNDPIVASQCHNIPRGITETKPKPIVEIASRLRFLSCAIFEAYTSDDGKHVDYRSIHGSEEFARFFGASECCHGIAALFFRVLALSHHTGVLMAFVSVRYLRTVEELQRVELEDMPREEKLAFFINLYNMMAIHAILIWGHPSGPLDRRKLFGDFKYVIGGCTYSLSAIQNGILRGNQRPPYNLIKPFGTKDKRSKVALPYVEPLIHFALVCGTRSGPALQCYSPGNIDKELMEAARNFLRGGGFIIDSDAKIVYTSKILKWFSVDFGNNELEVLKHMANYLVPADSELLLELLAAAQLKVIYQPYDWGMNR
ncbi:hypothetical protein Ancab_038645 [Ancistrocladus abbreviatus]